MKILIIWMIRSFKKVLFTTGTLHSTTSSIKSISGVFLSGYARGIYIYIIYIYIYIYIERERERERERC